MHQWLLYPGTTIIKFPAQLFVIAPAMILFSRDPKEGLEILYDIYKNQTKLSV